MIRKYLAKGFGVGFCILQYGCIAHCFVEHIAEMVICSGPSMEPTIYSEDIIISEHITTKFSKYERGDVVILRSPSNPKMFLCKRIIGIPGDKIKINSIQHSIVPRGHIWLEGDNKNNSTDSRSYGPVPQGLNKRKSRKRSTKARQKKDQPLRPSIAKANIATSTTESQSVAEAQYIDDWTWNGDEEGLFSVKSH